MRSRFWSPTSNDLRKEGIICRLYEKPPIRIRIFYAYVSNLPTVAILYERFYSVIFNIFLQTKVLAQILFVLIALSLLFFFFHFFLPSYNSLRGFFFSPSSS